MKLPTLLVSYVKFPQRVAAMEVELPHSPNLHLRTTFPLAELAFTVGFFDSKRSYLLHLSCDAFCTPFCVSVIMKMGEKLFSVPPLLFVANRLVSVQMG